MNLCAEREQGGKREGEARGGGEEKRGKMKIGEGRKVNTLITCSLLEDQMQMGLEGVNILKTAMGISGARAVFSGIQKGGFSSI